MRARFSAGEFLRAKYCRLGRRLRPAGLSGKSLGGCFRRRLCGQHPNRVAADIDDGVTGHLENMVSRVCTNEVEAKTKRCCDRSVDHRILEHLAWFSLVSGFSDCTAYNYAYKI